MLFYFIGTISTISVAIPLFFGFFNYKKLSVEMKILVWYLLTSFVFEIVVAFLILLRISSNTLWLSHVFPIIEYIFLVVIFSRWQRNIRLKKIYLWGIPFMMALMIVNILFFQPITQANTYVMSIHKLLLIGISAFALLELSKENIYPLTREYRFWVATGILFYNVTTLIMFSLLNNIIPHQDIQLVKVLFSINIILNIITYIIYAEGFLCRHQAQKSG